MQSQKLMNNIKPQDHLKQMHETLRKQVQRQLTQRTQNQNQLQMLTLDQIQKKMECNLFNQILKKLQIQLKDQELSHRFTYPFLASSDFQPIQIQNDSEKMECNEFNQRLKKSQIKLINQEPSYRFLFSTEDSSEFQCNITLSKKIIQDLLTLQIMNSQIKRCDIRKGQKQIVDIPNGILKDFILNLQIKKLIKLKPQFKKHIKKHYRNKAQLFIMLNLIYQMGFFRKMMQYLPKLIKESFKSIIYNQEYSLGYKKQVGLGLICFIQTLYLYNENKQLKQIKDCVKYLYTRNNQNTHDNTLKSIPRAIKFVLDAIENLKKGDK